MRVEVAVSITERHGQYYARWRSDEVRTGKDGQPVRKQYFEPTGVPIPPAGSSRDVVEAAEGLAMAAAAYMAELTGKNVPCAELQQIKLKEFALRSARASKECIREFVPLWLIDYATTKNEAGNVPQMNAVWTMANTWNKVLEALGPDRERHPSLIPPTRLQQIVDALPGKQERHAINVRFAFGYGVANGKVIKSQNPAEDLVVRSARSTPKIPFSQLSIQRGLNHMASLKDGDQWQLVTLCGVYTPMRFLTACRLRLRPHDFTRPQKPGPCAVLSTDRQEWQIEYYDTKGKKWETQLLDPVFVLWLKPYLAKHNLAPGDYLMPSLARLGRAPSQRWERIMEASGCQMQYAADGRCRTGYHALRISLDKWLQENEQVALSQDDLTNALRHTHQVHREHYASDAINAPQQRKINANRPKFLPGNCDLNAVLFELREEKQRQRAVLEGIEKQEKDLLGLIQTTSNHANKTEPTRN